MNTEFVTIVPHPAKWISINSINPPPNSDPSLLPSLIQLTQPSPSSSTQTHHSIITSFMPSTIPSFNDNNAIQGLAPIKNSHSPYSDFIAKGYRSGRRSAIIPCKISNNKKDWIIAYQQDNEPLTPCDIKEATDLIRLKGCGMWIESDQCEFPGFTLRETTSCHAKNDEKLYEIRGCAFKNTALTEIYATQKISESLARINVTCGNIPLGTWFYDPIDQDQTPLIQKAVVVMKTLGDKRLETHLLAGMEQLLKEIDPEEAEKAKNKIKEAYAKHKTVKLGDELHSYTKSSFVPRNEMANVCMSLIGSTEEGHFSSMNDPIYISLGYIPSNEIKEALKGIKCKGFDLSSLVELYTQIGFECGRSLASIHRAGFLWGTYVDHCESEVHCNAHPDNMIILSKELAKQHNQLLAPVDFDMAFEARCAFNIWLNEPKPDPTIVSDNFSAEHCNLLSDIVGLAASFPGMSTAISHREQPTGNILIVLESLRDAAAWAYLHSYTNPAQTREFSCDELYPIIEMALKYTENVQS